VPELGSHGSVRGARGNSRPYRESYRCTVKMTRLTHFGHPVAWTFIDKSLRLSESSRAGLAMKRREFITLLGGTPGVANSDTRAIHAKDGHDSYPRCPRPFC
jgi:hypothetical protein